MVRGLGANPKCKRNILTSNGVLSRHLAQQQQCHVNDCAHDAIAKTAR